VLNGVLWVLRTGAPWHDLPERYPPYQTCHRRFQAWVRDGTLASVLHALAEDLRERGGLDLSECFIDGTFVAKVRSSWQWQTALVFRSPHVLPPLRLTRSRSSSRFSTPAL
jgi:hypothetical protein